ncbi:MAG: hypothetical protein L0323_22215 [Planctomycetes bacterium]|nr:hypothetical protein [Planctomycetota bacterium]
MSREAPDPVVRVFRTTIEWLQADRIPFFVMGGIAFQIHGIPRATFDVDLTVAADRGAIVEEPYLRGWTDTLAGMKKAAFVLPVGQRPVPVELFLLTTTFQRSAFSRRIPASMHRRRFPLVTIEDLLLFKRIAGRRKDEADALDLLAFGGSMGIPYVRRWATRLRVAGRFRTLAREAGRADLS